MDATEKYFWYMLTGRLADSLIIARDHNNRHLFRSSLESIVKQAKKYHLNPYTFLIFQRHLKYDVDRKTIIRAALLECCLRFDADQYDEAVVVIDLFGGDIKYEIEHFISTCHTVGKPFTYSLLSHEDLYIDARPNV